MERKLPTAERSGRRDAQPRKGEGDLRSQTRPSRVNNEKELPSKPRLFRLQRRERIVNAVTDWSEVFCPDVRVQSFALTYSVQDAHNWSVSEPLDGPLEFLHAEELNTVRRLKRAIASRFQKKRKTELLLGAVDHACATMLT